MKGNPESPLGLGDLFESYAGWASEKEALELFLPVTSAAFDHLVEGTRLTLSEVFHYFGMTEEVPDAAFADAQNSSFDCDVEETIEEQEEAWGRTMFSFCSGQEEGQENGCCLLEREISANYSSVLKMLQYTSPSPVR